MPDKIRENYEVTFTMIYKYFYRRITNSLFLPRVSNEKMQLLYNRIPSQISVSLRENLGHVYAQKNTLNFFLFENPQTFFKKCEGFVCVCVCVCLCVGVCVCVCVYVCVCRCVCILFCVYDSKNMFCFSLIFFCYVMKKISHIMIFSSLPFKKTL